MWPTQYPLFLKFLEDNLHQLHLLDSSAFSLDFPNFELMPFDYLDFAEEEIEKNGVAARINCIAHLKRAVECELDTFLRVFGLKSAAKNLPQKIQFAADAGLFSPRSINKLNRARNKLEHEYSVPESLELENYFDIATGFVHSVEGCIYILAQHEEMHWGRISELNHVFGARFDIAKQELSFYWPHGDEVLTILFSHSAGSKQIAYGLHIYLLLCKSSTLLSAEYVIGKLKMLYSHRLITKS